MTFLSSCRVFMPRWQVVGLILFDGVINFAQFIQLLNIHLVGNITMAGL